jgi:LmbE family N-acetylglucosaminyl deacetylase
MTGEQRTLVGVWAHPDDEAYLSAGLMAAARRRGDRVVVITATLGEHGTVGGVQRPPADTARLREAELRASLAQLGVDELRLLGYEDGGCDAAPGQPVIAELLAELRPDLVVTFGPDGMTGHPDHRAVSRWVSGALDVAAPGAELWWATQDDDFHRRWSGLNDEIGLWADQPHPPCTPRAELAWQVQLSGAHLTQKIAALRAHASQTGPLESMVGAATYAKWWSVESFRPATSIERAVIAA